MELKRLHVLLVCNLGASTGVMVAKMRQIAEKSEKLKGVDILIDARPLTDLKEYINRYDCVLVGPQMKHKLEETKTVCDEAGIPCDLISAQDYGLADGAKILKHAIRLILEKKSS